MIFPHDLWQITPSDYAIINYYIGLINYMEKILKFEFQIALIDYALGLVDYSGTFQLLGSFWALD